MNWPGVFVVLGLLVLAGVTWPYGIVIVIGLVLLLLRG
jgi:hypothetical protein